MSAALRICVNVMHLAFALGNLRYPAGAIRTQEAPLQRDHDKWNPTRRRGFSDQFTTIVVVNGIIVLALIAFALSTPSASEWISAAVQAEFGGGEAPATPPTQIAQPAEEMRIVRSN
jgi:hypothetical protein